MKIGQVSPKVAAATADTERKSGTTGGAARASSPAEPSAKVALSPAALRNAGVPTEVDTSEFDSAKVDRIAQAIRDGKFTVNADAIADKLIANASELLAKARQ